MSDDNADNIVRGTVDNIIEAVLERPGEMVVFPCDTFSVIMRQLIQDSFRDGYEAAIADIQALDGRTDGERHADEQAQQARDEIASSPWLNANQ